MTPTAEKIKGYIYALLILSMMCLVGYAIYKRSIAPPPYQYAYTIWAGSDALGAGWDTDSYEIKDGMIIFISMRGKKITIPMSSVQSIVEE